MPSGCSPRWPADPPAEPALAEPIDVAQARLEIDFSLGFPVRYSEGMMLGAKVVSLYGRDTDLAVGHLGFINIVGWARAECQV